MLAKYVSRIVSLSVRRGRRIKKILTAHPYCFAILSAVLVIASLATTYFFFQKSLPDIPQPSPFFSEEWNGTSLPFSMPPIKIFSASHHVCRLETYGAIGDGKTLNTSAFALAIDDCFRQGGGTVAVPEGHWLTGPIHLKSNIRLDLAENAEVIFSDNPEEYLPVVFSRYEGMEYYNYSPLIYARNCQNVAITGKGTLNGQGKAWWDWKVWQQKGAKKLYAMADTGVPANERVFGTPDDGLRPPFIQFVHCSGILVEDVTIRNGPMWTLQPTYSDTIAIRNITIDTDGPNTDGIVIDSSRDVLIENVSLNTEDDSIVIKSGVDKDGRRVNIPSKNIIIRDCTVGRGNGGVVIGSETSGDVRNIFVSHCRFDGTKRGIRVKSAPGRGGVVENVWVEDISMNNIQAEAIFLNMYYDSKNVVRPTTSEPPIFRNFFFKNIECSQANDAIVLVGANNSPIQNITFKNIRLTAKNGIEAHNVDGLQIKNFDIPTIHRPAIHLRNVENAFFDDLKNTSSAQFFMFIEGSSSKNIFLGNHFPTKAVRLGAGLSAHILSRETQ